MSLSDLAALGSFISGLAVLISLVFLYFQLRQLNAQVQQSERNQQAAIRQGRTARMVELNLILSDPAMADAVRQGFVGDEDMTATQVFQFTGFCRASLFNAEDSFYQHAEGLLNDDAIASAVAALRGNFRLPGYRAVWKTIRPSYGTAFSEFMDTLIADIPVIPTADFSKNFKEAIAAEIAPASR